MNASSGPWSSTPTLTALTLTLRLGPRVGLSNLYSLTSLPSYLPPDSALFDSLHRAHSNSHQIVRCSIRCTEPTQTPTVLPQVPAVVYVATPTLAAKFRTEKQLDAPPEVVLP